MSNDKPSRPFLEQLVIIAVAWIAAFLIAYLIGAFCSSGFDISLWDKELRYTIAGVTGGVMILVCAMILMVNNRP